MTSQQRTSPDLATMLPGPRFNAAEQVATAQDFQRALPPSPPQPRLDEQTIAEQREARRERRRMKQASPLEGRNVRHSSTGDSDGGPASPTRAQPQRTPPPINTNSPEINNADMARYGLAVDTGDVASPTARQPRQSVSNTGRQSPEPRTAFTPTASDQGSDLGSPSRRISRTDLHSSRDSLESLPGVFRANRKGSGFKRTNKAAAAGAGGAKPASKTGVGEMHVVGEIVGASGFSAPMLFCRWELVYEPAKSWKVLRGLTQGSTHACCREVAEDDMVVWEHPLDVHMQTQSLQGWPSLLLYVHARDETSNRDAFVSYALVKLPTTSGLHHVSSRTWFAVETSRAAGHTFFGWYTGLIPRLEDEGFITNLRQREDAGPFICTVGAGEVHLRLNILTKNFANITHRGGESLAAALERLNMSVQKSVIMEERRRSHDSNLLTEGQKLVRSGREERMAHARAALDARRRGDQASPAVSVSGRNPSLLDQQGSRSSFRGVGGVRQSASGRQGADLVGAQDIDSRSETSFSSYSRPRDRYAERQARRERDREKDKATKEGAGSARQSVAGGEAAAPGNDRAAPPSRPTSVSGGPISRTNSGYGERSVPQSGRGGGGAGAAAVMAAGTGTPVDDGDDGLETIAADDSGGGDGDGVGGSDSLAGRAAARTARRAQQRSAF